MLKISKKMLLSKKKKLWRKIEKYFCNDLGNFPIFLTMESSKLIDYLTSAKLIKLFDIVLKYVTYGLDSPIICS